MIEMAGVAKAFGRRIAIVDTTLSFPSGTVTCVVGLNGAGKTTLLRLIAGLDEPDCGCVVIAGKQLRHQSDPMRTVGMHLGPDRLNPRHTVRQHLTWLAALGGIESSRIERLLTEVGLSEQRAQRISTLSTGGRQRLAIASALVGNPQAVLFDEPLNALDVPGIVWFRRLLRRLAGEGRAVVVASHILGEIALTADRLVILDRGRVAAAGAVKEIVPADADVREYLEQRLLGQLQASAL